MPPAPGIQTFAQKTVYIVEHRTELNTSGNSDEPSRQTSYLTEAYTSKNQAYRVAIREQITWLQQCQPGLAQTAAQINARKGRSLDYRLDQIQDKLDEIEKPQLKIQKWDVREFRLSEDSDHSSDEEDEDDEDEEDELDELEDEEEEEVEEEEEEEDQEETEDDEDGDEDDDEVNPPAKRPRH